MKKILLGVGLLISTGIGAQTYFFNDDFSNGLGNWTVVDSDGDGHEWFVEGDVATSASYDNDEAAALTPDNWMISNAIDLTGATGIVRLNWRAYALDQDWADENYSVYVSTNNDVATLTSEGADFNEVIGTSAGYEGRNIDVSAYADQTIYIAFRHHNVSDQFRLNIDDVSVSVPLDNDLELSAISVDKVIDGDRTFEITVISWGVTTVTSFDVDWSFGGGATTTENVTGVSLEQGDSHTLTVNVNGIEAGTAAFNAEITTADDDATNNSLNESFTFYLPVPQYQADDSYGEAFDLHERLASGQAIVLDFMASWCGPCESSTPDISEFIQNNGSGNGNVEAVAITVEANDNATVLNNLDWNGGFYSYPKIPYVQANDAQYYHYGVNHDLNSGGSIPFFVMICPNPSDPGRSSIVEFDVGYQAGMFDSYQTALNNCAAATADIVEVASNNIDLNIYPNPTATVAQVAFENTDAKETNVSLINAVGQVVYNVDLGAVSGPQNIDIDVASIEAGIYLVKITSGNTIATKRLSVAH